MDQRFACRFFIALFLVCCFSPVALAQKEAEDLERAFAATFALVPEVARFHAGVACGKHGQQAVEVVRARDSGMGQAAALALLAPPQRPASGEEDTRVDAAVLAANTAIVTFVFGPARPTAELAGAIVNASCLLEAGKAIGHVRI
ncbi:hypothetical protein [Variovorax rhizosphaerae]|uniref:Excinuclease ABC subunit A n=1 Tax=Variovorax rhizosphaerae TaxID=1836200 RepID=A0ABU8WYJ7_9BURK